MLLPVMVRVRVPASVANFGPAFDALAVAVNLYNEFEMEVASAPAVTSYGEGAQWFPSGETNLVHRAAAEVARRAGTPGVFAIRSWNHVPVGRGLGSSAAAIVGGAVGANVLLGNPLDRRVLLDLAATLEGHPDNAAAAIFGGAVVTVQSGTGWTWARFAPAWDAVLVVTVPEFAVPTADARRVLAERVPLSDAVANVGRTGLLVTAMLTGRADLLRVAMDDTLHQPYRAALIPGMTGVFAAAHQAGAFGAALCGSGPAIVAVCPPDRADAIGAAMMHAFAEAGQLSHSVQLDVDTQGATVLDT